VPPASCWGTRPGPARRRGRSWTWSSTATTRSVQILLSTYNGERFLAPLLESLRAQDADVLIRDDGSTDGTFGVLRSYGLEAERGEHVGFVRSFGALLERAEADWVAFCDQDDVWLPGKLTRAVGQLEDVSGPALYCGRLRVVDAGLRPLGLSPLPRRGLSFRNALVESRATGCTIVLNRAARDLVDGFPPEVVSHDWWLYLVLSAFGKTIYDEEPRVLFRKHAGQAFGIGVGALDSWRAKVAQARWPGPLGQVRAFRDLYGERLDAEKRRVLERLLAAQDSVGSRLRYAASPDVYRQSARDQALLRAKLALGRL
jgi:glycosyltransferase involved in cell wall biosynthesis